MSTDTAEEQMTLRDFVRKLIHKHPSARNDYRLLVTYAWFYQTGNHSFTQFSPRQLKLMSSPESITRAFRALIRDEPELGPDEEVTNLRANRQKDMRQHFGRRSP